jgi:hypothetical protein
MSTSVCSSFLTSTIYQSLAPSASGIYTYNNFCTAIGAWNANTANAKIFDGATDLDKKNEVAAFFGHVLHESGDLVYPREISECGTFLSGYCLSSTTGGYSAYCSTGHTTATDPNGCNCAAVTYSSGGYEANKMFFGRGPVSNIDVVKERLAADSSSTHRPIRFSCDTIFPPPCVHILDSAQLEL